MVQPLRSIGSHLPLEGIFPTNFGHSAPAGLCFSSLEVFSRSIRPPLLKNFAGPAGGLYFSLAKEQQLPIPARYGYEFRWHGLSRTILQAFPFSYSLFIQYESILNRLRGMVAICLNDAVSITVRLPTIYSPEMCPQAPPQFSQALSYCENIYPSNNRIIPK